MDVFDGYSFKDRHSVIIDDEEEISEEEEGEEEEEDQDVTGRSILAELNGTAVVDTVLTVGHEEPTPEPKTPEARPAALPPSTPPAKRSPLATRPELPPVDTNLKPVSVADAAPRASEETTAPIS
jgi:serum/glucocorticoid-regulated kinase 2